MIDFRTLSETRSAFVESATQAMTSDPGDTALDALGWWGVLGDLDDPELGSAALAVFQAQGRTLSRSPALGALMAQPYLVGTAVPFDGVVAAVPRTSARRGNIPVVVGALGNRRLLLDQPGRGVTLHAPDSVELRPVGGPGGLDLFEVVTLGDGDPLADDEHALALRSRSYCLGRIALAFEIAGAAESAVALAIEHAITREQFGEPIGRFQAVRHLLAWARTDCVAIETLARQALSFGNDLPPRYDEVVKATAGRNGRRACERALQVLGGIGFTEEHQHHRFHQRVLAADALLGSSAALTASLGGWWRTAGTAPGYTRAALAVPA